jgi:hypothetical protein
MHSGWFTYKRVDKIIFSDFSEFFGQNSVLNGSIPKISSKLAQVKFGSKSGKNAFLIAFSIEKNEDKN